MNSKLTDSELEELRDRYAAGETVAKLAEEFGVSERHVRRLTADVVPPRPVFAVSLGESVEAALDTFLELVEQAAGDVVRVAAALLARRLDRADSRSAAALARGLVDILDELRGTRAPDRIDELRRRGEARRLAQAASRQG